MQNIDAQELSKPFSVGFLHNLDCFSRRALDIIASAIGLLLLAPCFALIALVIRRDSPGPVFYRGQRVGWGGKVFGILKFRTMFERPDSYHGPRVTAAGDTRITPFGRWLRDTKLNELPQLWNVLVGDMSLVGPRPEDPEIARHWHPFVRELILSVRPGITSPATVVFRSEEHLLQSSSVMDDYLRTILPDKLRLDSIYIRNRSLLSDLDILFMTLILLLPRIRNTRVPETLLYWGPLARFSSRFLNWFISDTEVAFAAIAISGVVWRLDAPLNLGLRQSLIIALVSSLCFSLTNYFLGLNQVQWRRASSAEVPGLFFSAGFTTFFLILIDSFFFHPPLISEPFAHNLPIGMLMASGLLSFFGFTCLRYRDRLLTAMAARWLNMRRAKSAIGERVLVIGASGSSQFATWLFSHSEMARAFSIIGIADDDPRKQGMYLEGYQVVGSTRDIPDLIARYDIGLILYTITNLDEAERSRILKACRATPARVIILNDIMAGLFAQIQSIEPAGAFYPKAAQPGD